MRQEDSSFVFSNNKVTQPDNNTETLSIDLSSLFEDDLTESGSFDVRGLKETSFGKLLSALPIPALLVDDLFEIQYLNEAWKKYIPDPLRLEKTSVLRFFLSQDRHNYRMLFQDMFEKRLTKAEEGRLRINNKLIWGRMYFRSIRLPQSRVMLLLFEDLTLEKEKTSLMDRIEYAKQEWEQTVDAVSDLIMVVDLGHRITRINKTAANKFGIDVREALGQPCQRLMHGTESIPKFCPMRQLNNGGLPKSVEYHEKHLGIFIHETIFPIEKGGLTRCVVKAIDVSERKQSEEKLWFRASHDSLTRLFNRWHVLTVLHAAFESAKRYNLPFSLCLCDIDDFKQINDMHGHQVGDVVLKHFAKIIKTELRHADVAGRYGGDELILGFPNTRPEGALESVERIRSHFSSLSFESKQGPFRITSSFGIASIQSPAETLNQLINKADKALYRAKTEGRNRVVTFASLRERS
jgi:diguanylate cyclase (GGDEF)-like protein/PAS domain S-box-containing protein